MTDAGWTSGKEVHEIGWYWWEENGLPIKAVQIEKGFTFSKSDGIRRDVMYVVGYGGFLEDKPGRFLGPISPDAYHQGRVAGLKDAEVIAQFMTMATPGNIAAALRFMADHIERQAQGGKS